MTTLAKAANEPWFEAYAIYNLGYIASLMCHYQEGYDQMMAGLAIWRKLGDPHYIALGLNFLVPTLVRLGRYQEAKTFMQESIALCELTRNRWGMGTAYRFLGLAYLADGQCEEAQANLVKSLETFGEYYVGWVIVLTLNYLGAVALLTGDLSTAQKTYLDVLRSAVEAQAMPIIGRRNRNTQRSFRSDSHQPPSVEEVELMIHCIQDYRVKLRIK